MPRSVAVPLPAERPSCCPWAGAESTAVPQTTRQVPASASPLISASNGSFSQRPSSYNSAGSLFRACFHSYEMGLVTVAVTTPRASHCGSQQALCAPLPQMPAFSAAAGPVGCRPRLGTGNGLPLPVNFNRDGTTPSPHLGPGSLPSVLLQGPRAHSGDGTVGRAAGPPPRPLSGTHGGPCPGPAPHIPNGPAAWTQFSRQRLSQMQMQDPIL